MKITYRPEIDGLRAIAVVAVILYHAQITIYGYQPFKGGFIGVDIFFVISGYLITSIILKELISTGSFSFKHFYERRIRRILPALLFVMLASLPLAWIYLLPNSFVDFSKSILYSLGFSSNFYFHYSGQEYGAANGLFKPFLHTWSLSVEEQFYIIFPVIILLLFRYFKQYLIFILILIFFISLGFADWGSKNYSSASFYFLYSRTWELLAGSILAYSEIKLGHRSKNQTLNLILPSVGLLLIILNIIFFKLEFNHPSIYTLPSIFGVCLIIWFSHKDDFITKILASKLFVGIGLISYSLYLWHYPVFAFARRTEFIHGDLYKKLLIGLITIILSIVSYYFVERVARDKKYKFKNIFFSIMSIFIILITCNLFVIHKDGFEKKFSKIYINNKIFEEDLSAESWKYLNNFNIQSFESNNKIKVLIIGDSHSKDLFTVFDQNKSLFKKYEFVRYGNNYNQSFTFPYSQKNQDLIILQNSKIFKQADVILISDYFKNEKSFNSLENFIKLFKIEKKIILTSNSNIYYSGKRFKQFYNLTLFDYFLLKNKNEPVFIDKDLTSNDIYQINKFYFDNLNKKKTNSINKKLDVISRKHNIRILYKEDFQCQIEKKICYGITDEGMKVYYDYSHYTLEGAKFFGKKIYELNWLRLD